MDNVIIVKCSGMGDSPENSQTERKNAGFNEHSTNLGDFKQLRKRRQIIA